MTSNKKAKLSLEDEELKKTLPVIIEHSRSGAMAKVLPYGATVISYQTDEGRELLFVSNLAKLDSTKPVRGGIPLVFPQFGQPDKDMPQHGFLRSNFWEPDESSRYDDESAAGIDLSIELIAVVNGRGDKGKWAAAKTEYDCRLVLSLKVEPTKFTTTLRITNTSKSTPFDFQALFHTYFYVEKHAALDPRRCNVVGMEGYQVQDKVTNETYELGDKPVSIDGLVDRVYSPPESGPMNLDVTIRTGGASNQVKLEATGLVDSKPVPVSAVVWNPNKEKAAGMADFGSEQFLDMICVEPGMLENVPALESGKEAELMQVMTAL